MDNPLKQYFRRPALFISLPSKGKYYPQGAIDTEGSGELPVYPMTAIDEITSKTPDALFNGAAVVEIIKSCVPAIKDPWSIPATDIDTILVGIRTASNGNDLDVETTCPKCSETSKYGANLVQLLSTINPKGYDETFKIGELVFRFKPLSYKKINDGNMAQFELQREVSLLQNIDDATQRVTQSNVIMKKLTEMNIELISNTIESITLPNEVVTNIDFIREYLQGCDRNTFDSIRQHVIKIREAVNIKPLKIKCIACAHEYEQPLILNVSDFFD